MTNSYYELAQETGYEELNFPPQPELQDPVNEFGPTTTPFQSNNGLTYVYDPKKSSWTLLKGDTASQAWVNTQLTYKLDKAGGTIMGGNGLSFKEKIDSISEINLKIHPTGTLELRGAGEGDCDINFTSVNGTILKAGSISVDGNVCLKFNDKIVTSESTIKFSNLLISRGAALLEHNDSSGSEVILFNLGKGNGSTKNKVIIPKAGNLNIGTTNDTLATITQDSVQISKNLNACGVLLVDESSQTVKVPIEIADRQDSGDPPSVDELATVAYVNSGRFSPGMSVFGEDETSTEVGGMWTANKRFFIKVSP